jgi:hypothetical protein
MDLKSSVAWLLLVLGAIFFQTFFESWADPLAAALPFLLAFFNLIYVHPFFS